VSALAAALALASGVAIADLPWTEAERILTPDRLVVLPLGAGAKEHGPHLPLRNDEILATYLSDRVLKERPVALLPTLTYGHYPAFLDYPGSVSLSADTQRDVVVQICRSIARYGPRRFYVLNTGISTAPPLQAASDALAREGVLMRFTNLRVAGHEAEERVRRQPAGTHADEIETSMVLYMRPEVVRMDKAVKDGLPGATGPLSRTPKPGTHLSPSGVYGDATLATVEKGRAVVEGLVAALLGDLDRLAQEAVPPGDPRSPLVP
jgi:creatinine amidohydrolase